MGMEDSLQSAATKFSFGAIVMGELLQGSLFIAVNGPLLVALASASAPPENLLKAYSQTAISAVKIDSLSGSQFILVVTFIVLCFAIAIVMSPFAKLFGFIVARILDARGAGGYSSYDIKAYNYVAFMAALVKDPIAKGHWEWELFLFYQRRAAVITFSFWLFLLFFIRYQNRALPFRYEYAIEIAIGIGFYVAVVAIFIEGSKVMRRTHDFYAKRFNMFEERGFEGDIHLE